MFGPWNLETWNLENLENLNLENLNLENLETWKYSILEWIFEQIWKLPISHNGCHLCSNKVLENNSVNKNDRFWESYRTIHNVIVRSQWRYAIRENATSENCYSLAVLKV